MLSKFARRIGRRSRQPQSTPDTIEMMDELEVQREVVEIAPDLLGWSNLDTPFPTVAFGGYVKYYRALAAPTNFADLQNYSTLVNLSVAPPSHIASPERPQEIQPLQTRRKTRRYSLSNVFSTSERSPQLFRWKRATCIITPSITEHHPSPIFTSRPRSSNSDASRSSSEMARSRSSKASSDSSSPDSIAFDFRQTAVDFDSTLSPDTPTSIYSNNEAINLMLDGECTRTRRRSPRRPVSFSSFWTAKSGCSQD